MKTLIITLAANEYVEKDGKLYHKEISREWVSEKGAEFGTPWGERANELLKEGRLITESTIRCRKWYLKKRGA